MNTDEHIGLGHRHILTNWDIVLLLVVFVGFAESCAATDPNTTQQTDTLRLISAQEALGRLYEYTGFAEIRALPPTSLSEVAWLETVEECDIPFLADSVVGRQVWKVKLQDIYIDSPRWTRERVEKLNPKDYEAWIDAETGQLVKIFSKFEGVDPDLAPEPPADSAEEKMKQTREIFTGFPSESPPVTFLEALGAAAGSNPLAAKEIVAICVMRSDLGKTPEPVWSIIGRGIPPVEIHESNRPMYMRNRMRSIVNATTGKLMTVTNSPPVLKREEDRQGPVKLTQLDIIRIAHIYCGISPLHQTKLSSASCVLLDSITGFVQHILAPQVAGRPVWKTRVTIDTTHTCILDFPHENPFLTARVPIDIDLYIDAQFGTLVKAHWRGREMPQNTIGDEWNILARPPVYARGNKEISIPGPVEDFGLLQLFEGRFLKPSPVHVKEIEAYFMSFTWHEGARPSDNHPEDGVPFWFVVLKGFTESEGAEDEMDAQNPFVIYRKIGKDRVYSPSWIIEKSDEFR